MSIYGSTVADESGTTSYPMPKPKKPKKPPTRTPIVDRPARTSSIYSPDPPTMQGLPPEIRNPVRTSTPVTYGPGVNPADQTNARETLALNEKGEYAYLPSRARGYALNDTESVDADRINRQLLEAEAAYYDQLNNQPPGGGGPTGGGGYGYGGVSQTEQSKAMAKMLQELLASDRFGPRDITQELADIDGAVTADQADATAAEGRLGTFIDGMGNPYGDMSLTESQRLSPEYADLLTANGADAGAYKAEVGLANTLADLGNDSDERFRKRMSALGESERGYNTLANKQYGDFARSELAASGSALAARLREKKRVEDKATEAEEQQVIMTLINALAAAGETADIKDFF